jgi:N-acetylglucosamine-6-phosphate deacetylase
MQSIAYLPEKLFTGDAWLSGHAVVVEGDIIHTIIPASDIKSNVFIKHLENQFLIPAFLDVQIYGAYNRLFAVYPDPETLSLMFNYCREGGACLFLPTVATNTIEVFYKCIDVVRLYTSNGGKGVYGLHLEGPWINEEKRGAHVKEQIHAPGINEVEELLEYGKGIIKMITLAPEVCSMEILQLIKSYGVLISAGHSNATYKQAMNSFDNGVTTATHLFNAMSPLHHREPGLVGAIFNHMKVKCSIIPDGYHVDYAAVKLAKTIMQERLFVITDAVTTTDKGLYHHKLEGDKYECNGTLSGSALTMYKSFTNLIQYADISPEEAIKMCSLYPAQAINCSDMYGRIAPGYLAKFNVMDQQLKLLDTIG